MPRPSAAGHSARLGDNGWFCHLASGFWEVYWVRHGASESRQCEKASFGYLRVAAAAEEVEEEKGEAGNLQGGRESSC